MLRDDGSTLWREQKQVENIVLTPGRQADIDRRAKEDMQIMSEMLLQWDERARSDIYYMDSMARRDTRLSALKLMDAGQSHTQTHLSTRIVVTVLNTLPVSFFFLPSLLSMIRSGRFVALCPVGCRGALGRRRPTQRPFQGRYVCKEKALGRYVHRNQMAHPLSGNQAAAVCRVSGPSAF